MSILSKGLLVNVSISQWGGRRIDKRATSTVETSHATEGKVGNYTKKLLPNAKELDHIQKLAGAIRVFFFEQTLPWCSDGSRIISAKNYLEFTSAFTAKKSEFDSAVASFLTQYPILKDEAKIKLGDLYREADYPAALSLQHAFSCGVTFMPVPDVADFRVDLSDQEKAAFESNMRDVEANAVRECYTRLYDVASKAVAKLNDPDAVFRDSLIDNIRELCQFMPKLNITDDATLEATRQSLLAVINSASPDAMRDVGTTRYDTAKQLSDITSKMSAFMGN